MDLMSFSMIQILKILIINMLIIGETISDKNQFKIYWNAPTDSCERSCEVYI